MDTAKDAPPDGIANASPTKTHAAVKAAPHKNESWRDKRDIELLYVHNSSSSDLNVKDLSSTPYSSFITKFVESNCSNIRIVGSSVSRT